MSQALSFAQLATHLEKQSVAPLYALIGEEDLLRDSALDRLTRAVLGNEGGDFNCDLFYGDEAEGTQVVSCALEAAVFSARRLVIVNAKPCFRTLKIRMSPRRWCLLPRNSTAG